MSRNILLLFLLLSCVVQVEAQQFMILQKGGNQKTRIKYEEGDLIRYQQKGQDFFVSDRIKEIHPDFLVLTENILKPEEIAVVDVKEKDMRNQTLSNLSVLMYSGAGLLMVAETINGLYHDKQLSYSNEGLVISGALAATGFVLSKLKYRHFRNQGRNKIQIIYLEERK
jgi:hypothetical protein